MLGAGKVNAVRDRNFGSRAYSVRARCRAVAPNALLGLDRMEERGRCIDSPSWLRIDHFSCHVSGSTNGQTNGQHYIHFRRVTEQQRNHHNMIDHSGSIQREAQNFRASKTFWIVPPVPRHAGSTIPKVGRLTTASRQDRLHILLVDDSALVRDVTGALLRHAGQEVVLAESGVGAVQMATEQAFDLILMDVRMPGMDGLTATKRIRELSGQNGLVPIVAHTTHCLPDQVARCCDAGMDAHVCKPVNYATLQYVVYGIAGWRRGDVELTGERARIYVGGTTCAARVYRSEHDLIQTTTGVIRLRF